MPLGLRARFAPARIGSTTGPSNSSLVICAVPPSPLDRRGDTRHSYMVNPDCFTPRADVKRIARRRESCLRCGGKIFKRRGLRSILGLIRHDLKKRGTMNRFPVWLYILLLFSSCSSGSSQTAILILDNPTWDRVNVQAVITNSADCDN